MAIIKTADEWGIEYTTSRTFNMITRAEQRVAKKKEALEDVQNEYELLEKQAFGLYKSKINYITLDRNLINTAANWLRMVKKNEDDDGNKLDKRKKYKEKDTFNYICDVIKRYLGLEDFEIINIFDYNYGQGKHIEFSSHNHNWFLKIPHPDKVSFKEYQARGRYAFMLMLSHEDSECCSKCVGSTFEENELKDIMSAAIEKYCSVDNDGD